MKRTVRFLGDSGESFQRGVMPGAFLGAFIGSLLNKKSVEESIEIGSAAAAIVVTKVGCAPAMPMQIEIEEFMKINDITK